MVNSRGEVALGRLEGVVSREVDVQEVNTTSVGRIIGSHDGSLPVVLVLQIGGASGAVSRWVLPQVNKLLFDSSE